MKYTSELIAKYNHALDAVSSFDFQSNSDAPQLQNYSPVITPSGRILVFGNVDRHPLLGAKYISTSDLVWFDSSSGFARTVSRWYRLADRADIQTGDLISTGRITGFAISDDKHLRNMLDERARELRELVNTY
ncbi:DUF6634 family protein [Thalassospira alkalitolerans]|uniref:DUF6634 family protein n=1 Tax=Thalassospira alkalitolerans TaxID=1293890 RepID=UPI003AA8E619